MNLQELLAELLDLTPEERSKAIERLRLPDGARDELRKRLAHLSATVDILEQPPTLARDIEQQVKAAEDAGAVEALNALLATSPAPAPRYRALEKLGEGGFGSVFKAHQDGAIERLVALKVLNLGMNSKQVIARFEQERQALALMSHEGVAAVHDAGVLSDGRPYFVMEYVPGKPVTGLADERRLTVEQRLRLFQRVCDAARHAHTKGLIHRDLKPANVLAWVEGNDVKVKVIDFGVAKALGGQLSELTVINSMGEQVIGTLAYMSPEQARGDRDIDTRSDVYSLGVLLYELLAGVGPFDFHGKSEGEIRRIIIEQHPPKPSTRLTARAETSKSVATQRQIELQSLRARLGGELGWICLKALKKDRRKGERYQSPEDLYADIDNYLVGRPLTAGPDSVVYRTRKLLKRNLPLAVMSSAFAAVLCSGIAMYIITIRAEQSRTQAERDNAKATLDFLTNQVLAGATPENIPDVKVRDEIVRAMIMPSAKHVATAFADRPLVEASVRAAIQAVLNKVGRSDLALEHAEAVLSIRRRILGDDHPETLTALNNYAFVLHLLGRRSQAAPLYRQALERRRRILGEDHADTIASLGSYASALKDQAQLAEADQLFQDALERARRTLGDNHRQTVLLTNNRAQVLESLGRSDEAAALWKNGLESSRRLFGEDHPDTIASLSNYASSLESLDRLSEAEAFYAQALERSRRVLGEGHPTTLTLLSNYAYVLQSLRRLPEAELLFKSALEQTRRVLGDDHPDTLKALNNYGYVLIERGQAASAEPLLKEAMDRRRRVRGEEHPETLESLNNYGIVLRWLARNAEAEQYYRAALAGARRTLGPDHRATINYLNNCAGVLWAQGRGDEAEPFAREALAKALAHPALGPGHSQTIRYAAGHAKCLDALGRHDEATAVRKRFGVAEPVTRPSSVPVSGHPTSAQMSNDIVR